jgi:hypothetical protein
MTQRSVFVRTVSAHTPGVDFRNALNDAVHELVTLCSAAGVELEDIRIAPTESAAHHPELDIVVTHHTAIVTAHFIDPDGDQAEET